MDLTLERYISNVLSEYTNYTFQLLAGLINRSRRVSLLKLVLVIYTMLESNRKKEKNYTSIQKGVQRPPIKLNYFTCVIKEINKYTLFMRVISPKRTY